MDTMFKRYSDPNRLLSTMSWSSIPSFVESLALEENEEKLMDVWMNRYPDMSFDDFKKELKRNTRPPVIERVERRNNIERWEKQSQWNIKELE